MKRYDEAFIKVMQIGYQAFLKINDERKAKICLEEIEAAKEYIKAQEEKKNDNNSSK